MCDSTNSFETFHLPLRPFNLLISMLGVLWSINTSGKVPTSFNTMLLSPLLLNLRARVCIHWVVVVACGSGVWREWWVLRNTNRLRVVDPGLTGSWTMRRDWLHPGEDPRVNDTNERWVRESWEKVSPVSELNVSNKKKHTHASKPILGLMPKGWL